MVVQLLARQVAQDVTDRPARAPGRPVPPSVVEPGEEMVKPRRFHIKYAERVQPGQCRRVHDMPSAALSLDRQAKSITAGPASE